MNKLLPTLLFTLFCCSLASAQALPELEKVKQIKLLESNREEVRGILADYKLLERDLDRNQPVHMDWFVSDQANIEVTYSNGKCSPGESYDWEVSEWKVTEIEIEPHQDLKLNKLGLNLSKFKKERLYLNHKEPKVYHQKELGILIETWESIVTSITFDPPKKYYLMRCDKDLGKRLLSTSSYFDPDFKERISIRCSAPPPVNVTDLRLSLSEVILYEGKSISNEALTLVENPDNYPLTYNYTVTGGKITGKGKRVLWDLSGLKSGTYSITAVVDNGLRWFNKSGEKTVFGRISKI